MSRGGGRFIAQEAVSTSSTSDTGDVLLTAEHFSTKEVVSVPAGNVTLHSQDQSPSHSRGMHVKLELDAGLPPYRELSEAHLPTEDPALPSDKTLEKRSTRVGGRPGAVESHLGRQRVGNSTMGMALRPVNVPYQSWKRGSNSRVPVGDMRLQHVLDKGKRTKPVSPPKGTQRRN